VERRDLFRLTAAGIAGAALTETTPEAAQAQERADWLADRLETKRRA
jgi:hypothetical protein